MASDPRGFMKDGRGSFSYRQLMQCSTAVYHTMNSWRCGPRSTPRQRR